MENEGLEHVSNVRLELTISEDYKVVTLKLMADPEICCTDCIVECMTSFLDKHQSENDMKKLNAGLH